MDLKALIREYLRIIAVARKPGKNEFLSKSKISAAGLAIVGVIGFAIFIAFLLVGLA